MSGEKLCRRGFLKVFAGVGASLAVTSILSGCQPEVKIVKETVEVEKVVKETVVVEGKSDENIPEIRFLTRVGPLGLFMKEFTRLYEEEHPTEVHVVIEEGTWEDISTKLMASAAAATLQDIFWQPYFYLPYNIANGVCAELDDALEASGVDPSIWYPWALECEKLDGKLYGIPLGVMPGWNEMIYNKDILDEAGVGEPDGPNMTWNDLIEMSRTIKDKTGKWAVDVGHWWWGQEMINRNFGDSIVEFMGKESGFLKEEVQQAHKMIYDMSNTYEIMPTSAAMEGDRNKMFAAGKLCMMVNCAADLVCGMAEAIGGRFKYGYTTIPQADRGLWGTSTWADSVNIYSGSENIGLAFKLAAQVASVEASKWTSLTTGMTPGACPAAWEDPEVAEKYPIYGYEGEWFKTNEPEPAAMPWNYGFLEFNNVFTAEWMPIKNGERPYEQAELEEINKKFNSVLAEPRP